MQIVEYLVQFLIVMTYICATLVSDAHANRLIKSYRIYFHVFLVLYLKTTFLNSLKIMKSSPITEYSDMFFHRGGVTPLSSWTPRAAKKNLLLVICITKMGQNFINFFSWVDIHGIYYIVENNNQNCFFKKYIVSN